MDIKPDEYYEGQSNLLGFFYTFDKSIEKINDNEIFEAIIVKYDKLNSDELGDTIIRKAILEFLDDEAFVEELLEKFNITILDLISTIYRKLSSVFSNTLFVKKVKSTVIGKKYAEKYV